MVFLGGAEASASPSFALPMFITIKKIIILHLFLGVLGVFRHTLAHPWLRPCFNVTLVLFCFREYGFIALCEAYNALL